MKLFTQGNMGFIVMDDGSMNSLWISDERASRPSKGFAPEFQMWFIHLEKSGKEIPSKDICELATATGVELMEESGAFNKVKNTRWPESGGYFLVIDDNRMKAYTESTNSPKKKGWWQVWK